MGVGGGALRNIAFYLEESGVKQHAESNTSNYSVSRDKDTPRCFSVWNVGAWCVCMHSNSSFAASASLQSESSKPVVKLRPKHRL